MNTEQTAQQLELAAQILRTGHPFMVSSKPNGLWCVPTQAEMNVLNWPVDRYEIRPILATPPDNRPLHNPDNLTAEQVGVGYRLALNGELLEDGGEMWTGTAWLKNHGCKYVKEAAFRFPISVSWPEAKPEVPPFQLPPPPPGMQWHRADGWHEGDLPEGIRPLVVNEESQLGDEHWTSGIGPWKAIDVGGIIYDEGHTRCRTRRPLTFTHAGKQWTYHRPDDPAPCDTDKRIHYLMVGDADCAPSSSTSPAYASDLRWNQANLAGDILGWRYADEKKTVPFDISDVPPCSVLSLHPPRWFDIYGVCKEGIYVLDDEPLVETLWKWNYLAEKVKINRSIPLTGKWNPDAWEPCQKQIDA